MSELQFKEKAQKVDGLCQETIKTLESYQDDKIKALLIDFQSFFKDYQLQTKLTIAFIGQYNAGKSTLIKALTGDPTVKISADVCTDCITEYSWHEVLLVDTPGIYAGKTEHDEITLDRISRCDLLVFMVSNELFNPQGGEFFKKVCEIQRVGQMLLVVNKMSRGGDPQYLRKSILEVIEPYHPNDFYTCFIDANSYLDAQLEPDQEEKEFLIDDSNFDAFLSSLEKLINRNKLSAKFATPLHRAVDTLDQARNLLSTDDPTTRNLLELLRRKVLKFKASQTRFQNDCQARLNDFEHEIIMSGDTLASKVDGQHTEDDINNEIHKAEQQIEILSHNATQRIQSDLEKQLQNLQIDLEELMQSPLGRSLTEEIAISSSGITKGNNYGVNFSTETSNLLKNSPDLLKSVGVLASGVSRDFVYNIGKFIGIKFKPWGAVNGAKFINGLGAMIGAVGVVVDIFMTIQEKEEKARIEQQLREARSDIRESFRKLASEIKLDCEENIKQQVIHGYYFHEIRAVEDQQNNLRKADAKKAEAQVEISVKLQEIKSVISGLS